MKTQDIQIKDYNYPLPEERIAKFPLSERDQSKLLVYDGGEIGETRFCRLPELLPEGALMVMNNTRVIQARLHLYKETGARVEILVLEPAMPAEYQENFARRNHVAWFCMVGGLKKWKKGELTAEVDIDGRKTILRASKGEPLVADGEAASSAPATDATAHGASVHRIDFRWDGDRTWSEILEAMGELPIPPYLNRATEESDKQTYQTVYSKIEGSVAAPTAGLHFTERVLAELDRRGIEREEVTLHVGAGTFRPVKSDDIGHHDMHTEHIAVRRETIAALIRHGGRAIAVGTTSVRTLESLYYMGRRAARGEECLHVEQWEPYTEQPARTDGDRCPSASSFQEETLEALRALLRYMDDRELPVLHASTQIIIAPGYRYRIVERMITNFHQPQSTLLLLVSAFIGEDWKQVYDYALANGFRFLSYGDSSLLIPKTSLLSS